MGGSLSAFGAVGMPWLGDALSDWECRGPLGAMGGGVTAEMALISGLLPDGIDAFRSPNRGRVDDGSTEAALPGSEL